MDTETIVQQVNYLLDGASSVTAFTITGGEPLEQPEFVAELARRLRSFNMPLHVETNGVEADNLDQLLGLFDVWSVDIKLPSVCGRDDLWSKHERFLKRVRSRFVMIKIVVGQLSTAEEIERAAGIISGARLKSPVFLQPVTDENGAILVSFRHVMELYEATTARLKDVRVMPQIHKMIGSM